MGWTGTHINEYELKHNKGEIIRKEIINDSDFEVMKDSFVGSTYYAAVRHKKDNIIFAIVMLTSVDNSDYFNFNYKLMDETEGPYKYDCPTSILKLLSPTDYEFANNWRQKCWERHDRKEFLRKCPFGTKIKISDKYYVKCQPNYQFKTDWWWNPENNTYIPKKYIYDSEYEVVA